MIECKNISFSYSNTQSPVFKDLNCRFEFGKHYMIQGDHGSGKSTLLKLIGLIHSFDGLLTGDVLHFVPQSRIAYVSDWVEGEYVYDNVYQEMFAVMRLLGYPKENIEAQILLILEYFQITHLKDLPISQLSKGQKQYCKLIKVLATKQYDYVCLDEPFVHLDQAHQTIVLQYLSQIQQEFSLVVIDHQPEHWASYFDFHTVELPSKMDYQPWYYPVHMPTVRPKVQNMDFVIVGTPLKHLSHFVLDYKPGAMVQITGANGSGKTTLCKMWMGMLQTDLLGSLKKRMLMDGSRSMFMKDNLQNEWGTLVEHPFALRNPFHFSAGQSKVEIFQRLIADNPDLLILDEPFVGLNIEYQNYILDQLQKLQATGAMILFTATEKVEGIPCDQIIEI